MSANHLYLPQGVDRKDLLREKEMRITELERSVESLLQTFLVSQLWFWWFINQLNDAGSKEHTR